MLKRADLASSEAGTSRCPSKRRYLNAPTTSPAVRHKDSPAASTGPGLSLLIVHPEGYRYGPDVKGPTHGAGGAGQDCSQRGSFVPWSHDAHPIFLALAVQDRHRFRVVPFEESVSALVRSPET